MKEYVVNLLYDDEAGVWVATSEDMPLTLESSSIEALMEDVRLTTPEALEMNNLPRANSMLRFRAERLLEAI